VKISLITPTFNQAEFLPHTLQSLREQQGADFEHIVIDAMSSDATPHILESWKNETGATVVREPDTGQSNAINKGANLASGEVIGWLNSDDILCQGALAAIAAAFAANPKAVVVYGLGSKMDRAGELIRTVPFREFSRRDLRTAYRVVQPAMFFRRDTFLKVGALDESLEYAMDWELLIRLAAAGDVVSIPNEIARIRYYEETKTSTGGWRRMREIAEIGRKYYGRLDPNFISYQIRTQAARLPGRFPRWVLDQVLWRVWGDRPIMVQGWPE
jgi:glycosyltransferase involved in cell wall biosynthesis